jgi:uncharacterized repeat protein (TIGR02543 family)
LTDHFFLGWFLSPSDPETALSNPWSPGTTGNVTLYARWSQDRATVTFEPNGGRGTMAAQTGGGLEPLVPNTFTRTGYTFAGWSPSSTATSALYTDEGDYSFAGDAVLYALWSANTYIVTFNSQGGTSVADGTYPTGGFIELPDAPRRLGYTFLGWFSTESGAESRLPSVWQPGTIGPITLFARWSANAVPTTATPTPVPSSSASNADIARIPTDVMPFALQTFTIFSLTGGGESVTLTPDGRIELSPDQSVALVNGVPVPANVTIDATGISFEHAGVTVTFRASDGGAGQVDEVTQVTSGEPATTTGSGFAPQSDVAVWIQSDPIQLSTLLTNPKGDVEVNFVVPESIAPGEHTIQLNGLDANRNVVSFLFGIEVLPATTTPVDSDVYGSGMTDSAVEPAAIGLAVGIVAAAGAVIALWFVARRRKRS